ncbi:hypothetical protein [Achromobacter sp.]|uniref:hypothetical protein n=1 Tax=Achromobacter sp. TaxID=134375 RepID=UPI0028B210BD|nr:hypothetical protein [Achromobacter sp.]
MTDTATPRAKPATATARPQATAGMAGLWLACLAAMGAGLLVDTWRTPAALLASECGAPGTLAQLAWRHVVLMPVSSAAMAVAALLPWSLLPWSLLTRARLPAPRLPWPHLQGGKTPLASRVLCLVLMAIGMVLGARLGVQTAQALGTAPFWGMVLGMAAGMAATLLPVAAVSAWRR